MEHPPVTGHRQGITMSNPVTGRCLCGAIAYKVNGPLVGVINCHCSVCRRWHGNFASYAVAMLSDFEYTAGAGLVQWFDSSEKARRGFCPKCGSSLFKDNKDGQKIVLSVGALDIPTGLSFLKNIFEESKGDCYALPTA